MTTYHLSCHCQAHILQLSLPSQDTIAPLSACDCSHCLKKRIVWGKAPKGSLKVIRGVGMGGNELKAYQFGSRSFAHQFCRHCGTDLLGDGFDPHSESYWYNVRAIRDEHFDLWQHKLNILSALDREPAYIHPKMDELPGAAKYLEERGEETSKVYIGSCHCQAIKFAVKSEPLETAEICDCNCSICIGNGVLWLYPPQQNIYFYPPKSPSTPYIPAEGLLTEYTFGKGKNGHYICKTCGCHVYEARVPEDPESGSFGVNITLLNNIGEYLSDACGVDKEGNPLTGKGGAVWKGLERDDEAKLRLPMYKLDV